MQYYILASRTSACSHAPHHNRWKNRIANSQISIGSNGSGGFAASAASVAAAASAARVCRRAGAVAASSDGSNVATVCLLSNRSATTITAKTASRTALWLVKHTVLPVTTRTDVDGKGAEADQPSYCFLGLSSRVHARLESKVEGGPGAHVTAIPFAEPGGKERRDKDAVLPSAKRARIKTDETPC